jgi:hypothetical protein
MAAMQEAGVPVTYGYISDIHERKDWSFNCTGADATAFGRPLGPGDACYTENAQRYDQAFAKFLDRMAADGITPKNTLFVIGAEEDDHLAGANVGRAQQPSDPADCDGVTVPCRYDHNQIGELQANLPLLLQKETGNTTPFDLEPQGAALYVHGQPTAGDPQVRQLERDLERITANNPYSGVNGEKITDYLAGATEQQILHLQTTDPLRTPTITLFPKPDYFFDPTFPRCGASSNPAADCATVFPNFAWNHGYYSPDIDNTWSSFVGPGVQSRGIDGPEASDSPAVHNPDGEGTVPQFSGTGTWADETDVRPTMLYLAGISDDYVFDGRVLSEITRGDGKLEQLERLGQCYKQLNASVGTFGTDTLIASTAALGSGSAANDATFTTTETVLLSLAKRRDATASAIKTVLDGVEFHRAKPDHGLVDSLQSDCQSLLQEASNLGRMA